MLHGRKKIVILHDFSEYTNGRAQAFRNIGHDVLEVPVVRHPQVSRAVQMIQSFQPHFIFAHDYTMFEAGNTEARKWTREFEEKIKNTGIPIVFYFLDAPERSGFPRFVDRLYEGDLLKQGVYFVPSQRHVNQLKGLGYHAEKTATGIPSHLANFRPSEIMKQKFSSELSFVGSPNFNLEWLEGAEGSFTSLSSETIQDLYLQSATAWLQIYAGEWFQEEGESTSPWREELDKLGHEYTKIFSQKIENPEAYIEAREKFFKSAFDSYSTSVARLARGAWNSLYNAHSSARLALTLRDLHENFELSIWGGEAWQTFLQTQHPTPAISRDECYAVAASSKIFFCQTKNQLLDSLHERVAYAFAVGGFPITDVRNEIFDYFEPTEVATYTNLEEAKDKIKFYLKNDSLRHKMSERGREITLQKLTYEAEMSRLISQLSQYF